MNMYYKFKAEYSLGQSVSITWSGLLLTNLISNRKQRHALPTNRPSERSA